MLFRDVTPGPHETQLRFRLIHFWEAWNPLKKTLIGIEMLLIDEEGSVIQGFISPSRIERHLSKMKPGSLYKLNNFYGSSNKTMYRVSDHAVTVSFSWNSELSVLEDSPTPFEEDRFRFHSFEEFQAGCDSKGDLYDVLGHMKLVNGQCLTGTPVLDEVDIARARHVLVHVQSYDGPVVKLYLWDQAARDFCKKFKSYERTPTVLLVTTVNTKSLGGTLALTTMSSSRVFMDCDVQPTVDYFSWLGSNPQSAELVNAEVVTKRETLTIGEIFSYIRDGSNKEAFFECTATIDDVVHGSTWYYISCSGCHTKATKGPTSLMCSKCGKVNISGVPQYRAQISVYDNSEQAVFVLLGDAGFELTGKHAAELVSSYFEANGDQGVTQEVPFPEALISTIGQKHNFCVKVTQHNLDGKSRSLTVTKILPMESPPVTEASGGNYNPTTLEEGFETGTKVCEASKISGDSAEGSKSNGDMDEMGKAKRLKRGVIPLSCCNQASYFPSLINARLNVLWKEWSSHLFHPLRKLQGQLLEGRVTGDIQPNDSKNLTEGDSYEFSRFYVIHNSRQRKLTQLSYYIQIGQRTTALNVTLDGPMFPVHSLSPQKYTNLLRLASTPTYLPDVVGQIVIIQKIKLDHPELNIDATIGLRLNRSTIVKLILCDQQAADFSILQSKKNRKFKVMIITSVIPKLIQGKLILHSSPATVFYFNKSIDYIKHFKRRIRDYAKTCSTE
ncbi:hypothetical protein IGI04_018544 [Brassica rapa subsp. trilocularis]|uniref:Replication factor A C-terminal domain-containing protein n=2 Tax=Brassica campestris TaxID=3711 RepID=A0ABQ7MFQ8_BRACM|nr:hypothetical protein IGI04_018544 [Brassica rapa subsp. trilocularis]